MKSDVLHQKLALERLEFCLAQVQLCLALDDSDVSEENCDSNDHFKCLFDHIFQDLKHIEKTMFP